MMVVSLNDVIENFENQVLYYHNFTQYVDYFQSLSQQKINKQCIGIIGPFERVFTGLNTFKTLEPRITFENMLVKDALVNVLYNNSFVDLYLRETRETENNFSYTEKTIQKQIDSIDILDFDTSEAPFYNVHVKLALPTHLFDPRKPLLLRDRTDYLTLFRYFHPMESTLFNTYLALNEFPVLLFFTQPNGSDVTQKFEELLNYPNVYTIIVLGSIPNLEQLIIRLETSGEFKIILIGNNGINNELIKASLSADYERLVIFQQPSVKTCYATRCYELPSEHLLGIFASYITKTYKDIVETSTLKNYGVKIANERNIFIPWDEELERQASINENGIISDWGLNRLLIQPISQTSKYFSKQLLPITIVDAISKQLKDALKEYIGKEYTTMTEHEVNRKVIGILEQNKNIAKLDFLSTKINEQNNTIMNININIKINNVTQTIRI